MWETLQLPFVQRGLLEVVLLAAAGGLVGTWIVLRGLAFFTHAVGAGAFPGLVLADGLSFSAHLGAAGTAGLLAGGVGWLGRRDRDRYDSVTALVLVAALAAGVVLASDVFHSGSNVERLLFGSLLLVDGSDIAYAAAAAAAALILTVVIGPRWLAIGFDPTAARGMRLGSPVHDVLLLGLVGFVTLSALSAIGALLATALLVMPAATTRLVCDRLGRWQVATVLLACVEGVVGLLASVELNAPPGPAIAVLAGAVFGLVAAGRVLLPRRRRRTPRPAVLAAIAMLVLTGCGASPRHRGVAVVATTTQLGDLVRQVGGSAVFVTQILQPNSDPHEYEPRPDDVRATAGARAVFESGGGLDGWVAKIVEEAGGSPRVVVVGESALRREARRSGDPTPDPHWWHDPRNVEAAVPVIRDALSRLDPRLRATFQRRADGYLAKLRVLDAGIGRCVSQVPSADRELVTDHDAFGYFARRYGIRVIGAVIPSQTTQAQPSAGAVAELVGVIAREHVRAVFPESSVSPRLAAAIARRTGASSSLTLYGDSLGPAGSDGATYLGMERHNADAMVRGFTGGARGCPIPGL